MNDLENIFNKTIEPVNERLCFVLMPFRKRLDEIYEDIIKQALVQLNFKCIRADEIYNIGSIINQIWHNIQTSGLIIADLTDKNPNVLYELGLAHACHKKVIIITQSIEDIPFDLRHLRCIIYENTHRGVIKLKDNLIKTVKTFWPEILINCRIIKNIGKKGENKCEFDNVRGIAVSQEGEIYVSDSGNHRIQIFSKELIFKKSFGKKGSKLGEFNSSRGLTIDSNNNIYICERNNNRIQKFDKNLNPLLVFATNDENSILVIPWGISIDSKNDIYVTSAGTHQVKKFDCNGNLLKYWGEFGNKKGQFNNPLGIVNDNHNNVYIADDGNNRIQKFNSEGKFITSWGGYGSSPNQMIGPHSITIFNDNLLVSEAVNFRIQMYTLNGEYKGRLELQPPTKFYTCKGMTIDNYGDIYISSAELNSILKIHIT